MHFAKIIACTRRPPFVLGNSHKWLSGEAGTAVQDEFIGMFN